MSASRSSRRRSLIGRVVDDCRPRWLVFASIILVVGCAPDRLPNTSSFDVVSGVTSADLPDAAMIAVGCTPVATDQKVRARLAVRFPLADGRVVNYSCNGVAPDSLGAAVHAYWTDLAPTRPRQAAITVEGWWAMEEPYLLDPPTYYGYWIQSTPIFRDEGYGWDIPSWTIDYYCEVVITSDPSFMVKCWEWIEDEAPGGGGGGGGDTTAVKLSVTCNHAGKKRGQEVTCAVSAPTGTITAAFFQFTGSGDESASGNVPGSWQLTGPLLIGGTLVVTG